MPRKPIRRGQKASLDPQRLYPFDVFKRDAGIGDSTLRKARDLKIELPRHWVGRQSYVRGCDGIDFLLRLSQAAPPAYEHAAS